MRLLTFLIMLLSFSSFGSSANYLVDEFENIEGVAELYENARDLVEYYDESGLPGDEFQFNDRSESVYFIFDKGGRFILSSNKEKRLFFVKDLNVSRGVRGDSIHHGDISSKQLDNKANDRLIESIYSDIERGKEYGSYITAPSSVRGVIFKSVYIYHKDRVFIIMKPEGQEK